MQKKIDQFITCLAELECDPFGFNQKHSNNLPSLLAGVHGFSPMNETDHGDRHTNEHSNTTTC